MKIQLINHASVIIETNDCAIWTDPWLFGTAFNDSWKLHPKPKFDNKLLCKINYIWISHEHPDHFHIPTLRSLPTDFKERVTVLFQKNNSDKMPKAFEKFGFKNIKTFKHRKIYNLTSQTKIQIAQIGQMDSSLAVLHKNKVVLNINDCEISKKDAKNFILDLGKINIVLNQFSMAGYNGDLNYKKTLQKRSAEKIEDLIDNHNDLNADYTIPIASYVYFCMNDNKFINEYANTPYDIYKIPQSKKFNCKVLDFNEVLDLNNLKDHDSKKSLKTLMESYSDLNKLDYSDSEQIEISKIKNAVSQRHDQMKSKFSSYFLKKLKKLKFYIIDLDEFVIISIANNTFEKYTPLNSEDYDIKLNSQPLWFAFNFTWGLQTLGVSGRYFIKTNHETWRWYRILTSLNNAEVYLSIKYLFNQKNIKYFYDRSSNLIGQLKHKLKIRGNNSTKRISFHTELE